MRSWATEELKYAALPDKRLNKRLIKIVENLAQQPHASIPQASGDWANTKATYNFWQSSRIEAHQKQISQRASKEEIILAIQDTSDFNFTHHQSTLHRHVRHKRHAGKRALFAHRQLRASKGRSPLSRPRIAFVGRPQATQTCKTTVPAPSEGRITRGSHAAQGECPQPGQRACSHVCRQLRWRCPPGHGASRACPMPWRASTLLRNGGRLQPSWLCLCRAVYMPRRLPRSKTEEQGFGMTCAQKYVRGLKVHSIMASTTQGVPLGILEQQIWTRPVKSPKKKKNQREKKSIFNKESKRWLTGLVSAEYLRENGRYWI